MKKKESKTYHLAILAVRCASLWTERRTTDSRAGLQRSLPDSLHRMTQSSIKTTDDGWTPNEAGKDKRWTVGALAVMIQPRTIYPWPVKKSTEPATANYINIYHTNTAFKNRQREHSWHIKENVNQTPVNWAAVVITEWPTEWCVHSAHRVNMFNIFTPTLSFVLTQEKTRNII